MMVVRYRLWDPKESKLIMSKNVTYDEIIILNPKTHNGHDNQVEIHNASKKVELAIEVSKQELKEIHEGVA